MKTRKTLSLSLFFLVSLVSFTHAETFREEIRDIALQPGASAVKIYLETRYEVRCPNSRAVPLQYQWLDDAEVVLRQEHHILQPKARIEDGDSLPVEVYCLSLGKQTGYVIISVADLQEASLRVRIPALFRLSRVEILSVASANDY